MLKIGSVVDGKYRLLSEIGHGGMSVVYLAINERANKTWAIKEVRKDGGNDSEVVQQGLIAETEMLKKLHHPHLPSIVDVIDCQDSFLIVMDYIEGKSLQSILNHNGPQSKENVIEWAKQLCDTLGYLHSRTPSIIYRDMKPANVMLNPDGKNVTLIDFGTAREYKQHSQGDTTWLGTRGYAAPEQFGGHGQTDGRTDIYCLGATMYHLLTGKSPADTQFVIYPVGQLNPSLAGSGIEKIVAKCCEPRPEDRYQNCAELMFDLENEANMTDAADRRRRLRLALFVLSCLMAVFSLVGMIVFMTLKNKATEQSFDLYINQAENAVDTTNPDSIRTVSDFYIKAARINPSNEIVYNGMLQAVKDVGVSESGDFTQEEIEALNALLDDRGEKNALTRNIDYFEQNNPAGYANFAYELAITYYGFAQNRKKAAEWFNKVRGNTHLNENQREVADALYTIGDAYQSIFSGEARQADVGKSLVDTNQNEMSVETFFYEMVRLTDGNVSERMGKTEFALIMYHEMAYQIYEHCIDFMKVGITEEQMIEQLDKVDRALDEMQVAEEHRPYLLEIKNLISNARNNVNQAFRDPTRG